MIRPLLVPLLLFVACQGPQPRPLHASAAAVATAGAAPLSWVSTIDRDAPLVGSVWQPSKNERVTPETVLAAITAADLVLLGEQHDNPDHHLLQARAIEALVRAGRKPTVALEMLEPDDDAVVRTYRASPQATAVALGKALDWEKSGWPAWTSYAPIAQVAFDAGLPLVSANLARSTVRSIAHGGTTGLAPGELRRLGLDHALPASDGASLEDELRASHCGQLPEAMVGPMALAQRARDGQMAWRMLELAPPVVLIAGAGHVRADRGVARILADARPKSRIVSVAFLEVDGAASTPAAYASRFHAATAPFDFVWFTPRASDADPCKDFATGKGP